MGTETLRMEMQMMILVHYFELAWIKDCAQIGAQPCMCLHMVLKLALIHPPSQEEADENGLPPALVCSFLGRFEYHMKTHTGLPHLPARNPWLG